jgi:hypothetical protein
VKARIQAVVLWGAPTCAVLASICYCLLRSRVFRDSWFYEGWVFLAHLALAGIGFLLGVLGIRKHPIVCGVSAAVSAYLLLIQFV